MRDVIVCSVWCYRIDDEGFAGMPDEAKDFGIYCADSTTKSNSSELGAGIKEPFEPRAKLWVDERQSHFESIFGVE
ncbi:MAG: hypothetical protein Q9M24_01180 [Mariprofundaceae bacterium]|nr:hypothetical protein [Mariprofundaceae bacterium]